MIDPGGTSRLWGRNAVRRVLTWISLLSAIPSTGKFRQFRSLEHVSTEAVAAFVDGELAMNAYLRAAHHFSLCSECAGEVEEQRQARAALRHSGEITTPASLLGVLNRIPHLNDRN